VAVIGVGVSLFGASIRALEGLLCESEFEDGGACAGVSCGGGVGSCIGTSMVGPTLLLSLNCADGFNSCALAMRASSGGHVVREAVLSCSTGEGIASSGVGMVRRVVMQQSRWGKRLITHGTKGRRWSDYSRE
jgi:hypothetical protein